MYTPRNPPATPEELAGWVRQEVQNIAAALNSPVDSLRLVERHVAPLKPRHGDISLADGTDWNPGSGAGFYGYRSGAWHFLG